MIDPRLRFSTTFLRHTDQNAALALPVLFLVLLSAAIYLGRKFYSNAHGAKKLPGPRGHPILGNLIGFPKTHAWLKFSEWAERYGPIYKLDIMGTTLVIVSRQSIADELLAHRGVNYSDRRHDSMVSLITGGGDLVASPSNDYWRRGRKFAAAMTLGTMANKWEPVQAREAIRMASSLVADPSQYRYWFERMSTLVSLQLGFGKSIERDSDARYHTNKIMSRMHEIERVAAPGAYLVDVIPALMRLPDALAPFKKEAQEIYRDESAYFRELLEEACNKFEKHIPETPPSFSRCWLEGKNQWDLSFDEAVYVMATLYGGGAGTTSFAMQSYCLAMCHYPHWQTELNKELERVVGPDRLPTFEDMPNLPIVRAVAKEILRWRPVVPANVPHRLNKDDIYDGYHIPAGALIFANQWAIHRDETLYPDAEAFNPDRWLKPEFPTFREPLEQHPSLKRFSAFGFGRRICPGFELAERSLFIQIATLAWACQITKKKVDGQEIPVAWYDYTNGSNSSPQPFVFDVIASDARRIEILKTSGPD